jgi:LysR family positive regulator for ilvC
MDFHSIELFLHLSNTLHFGKTSQACHISPSALSRTISRLEEEIGSRLFVRDNRSVELSDVGTRFKVYARSTMDQWQQFRESLMTEEDALQGEIILYCSVTAAFGILADLFSRFRENYPQIHIHLQTGDAANSIERVLEGSADITVAARPEKIPNNLLFKTITNTPLQFIAPVVPCEVTAQTTQTPIPWRDVPMILAEQALSRRRVDAWFRRRGIRPNIYAEVAGHEAILSMVRLGCGVGVVPALVLETSPFRDEVRVLEVTPALTPYRVGICLHKRRLGSPVVRAFWEIVDAVDL